MGQFPDPYSTSSLKLPSLSVATIARGEIRARRMALALERGGLTVAGQASVPEELVARFTGLDPDAVVLAPDPAEQHRPPWACVVREALPDVRVVMVVPRASWRDARRALAEGVDGLILERQLEDCLSASIRAVCSGQLSLPSELRQQIARPVLSAREKQILSMVVMGFSNLEIARQLYLAESTVKSHLSSAFAKLGVRSRNEAAALILDPEKGFGAGILAISEGDQNRRPERARSPVAGG